MHVSSQITKAVLCAAVVSSVPLASFSQRIIDFSDLSLAEESFYNGADGVEGFSSGGLRFNNTHSSDGGFTFWSGWAYSNVTAAETPGWGNQYAAITGSGLGENGIYAVGFQDDYGPTIPRIELAEGDTIAGVQVTNTAYAYYAMLNGELPARAFTSEEQDFFRLTITGLNAAETETGSVDFFLADYRDDSDTYIIDDWEWIDLSALGEETRFLEFTLESSDTGILGSNTPLYFALGEVAVIPEPSTYALLGGLLAGGVVWFRRRR